MIKKLYQFGKYIPDHYFENNPLNLNLEYGKSKKNKKKIVSVNFKEFDEKFEYQKIEVEDYDPEKNPDLYLFKNAIGNSVSPFPTIFYEKKCLQNNQLDFTSKAGKKILKILNNNSQANDKLKKLLDLITKNDFHDEVIVEDDFILSIKIDEQYPGQASVFKPVIEKYKSEIFKSFYEKYTTTSKSDNKSCYFCHKKSEVWGFVDLNDFKFYSSNEESVIAGGFKKEYSWKNYPVCSSCSERLVKYKAVLEKYLSFRFFGFNYFLVPEIIFDREKNQEILELIADEKIGWLNLKNSYEQIEVDDEILDALKESHNFLNYNLFFYERNKSEFKIIMSIDEVFPSRFREIYETKIKISQSPLFKNLKGIYKKNQIDDLKFDFRILKHFFPNSKTEGDHSRQFLQITRAVFTGRKIDYDLIMHRIIDKIRSNFVNDYNTEYDVLKAILLFKFITTLSLWSKKDYKVERELKMDSEYEEFFNEHAGFFESNTKKAVFLEGVLCQFLLNIQYLERKATPFKARLNSLKLDEQKVKRLLPEIINKLEEYDSNYYKELESIISEYLLDSKFNLTNDEISFYFVMGMNLAKKFKTNKEMENNNEPD